jgi:parallel beta-helix repeat protein
VRITQSLKLMAKSKLKDGIKVRILPGPGQTDGIVVEPANLGDPDIVGVKIQGFTVEGFSNNGIWLKHVQKFTIQGNESINNLENGIWPTLSANGSVKKNVAYGSQDSALWVEASENVRVMQNEFHHSPTGLEITVSKDVKATKNDIHDNTIGVGLYHPNGASLAPLGGDGDWVISKNHIHDNNLPNSAPPGSMSAALPPGVGVLVLGVDRVTVEKNLIENNNFVGVAVLDWCLAVGGSTYDCATNPPIVQSAPDNTLVKGNSLAGNGGIPPGNAFDLLAGDLSVMTLHADTSSMFRYFWRVSGGLYDEATMNIAVVITNEAPYFITDPFTEAAAAENAAYSGTIAGAATDPNAGDTLTFSKRSGPAWLGVSTNGALSGTRRLAAVLPRHRHALGGRRRAC